MRLFEELKAVCTVGVIYSDKKYEIKGKLIDNDICVYNHSSDMIWTMEVTNPDEIKDLITGQDRIKLVDLVVDMRPDDENDYDHIFSYIFKDIDISINNFDNFFLINYYINKKISDEHDYEDIVKNASNILVFAANTEELKNVITKYHASKDFIITLKGGVD